MWAPEARGAPEAPEAPGAPEVPGAPELPEPPEAPEAPEVPERQEHVVPETAAATGARNGARSCCPHVVPEKKTCGARIRCPKILDLK